MAQELSVQHSGEDMVYFSSPQQTLIKEDFKTQILLKLGHCPNRVGGWLTVDFIVIVPTV